MIEMSKKLKSKQSFTVFKPGKDDPFMFATCQNHISKLGKQNIKSDTKNLGKKGFLNFNFLDLKSKDKNF